MSPSPKTRIPSAVTALFLALATMTIVAPTTMAQDDCSIRIGPVCVPPLLDGGNICGAEEYGAEGLFAYQTPAGRDPIASGTYYWAITSGQEWGERIGGNCYTSIDCTITAADAGFVTYKKIYYASQQHTPEYVETMTGEWKGVAIEMESLAASDSGSAWCGGDFGFEGYLLGLLPISGAKEASGDVTEMLGPITPP